MMYRKTGIFIAIRVNYLIVNNLINCVNDELFKNLLINLNMGLNGENINFRKNLVILTDFSENVWDVVEYTAKIFENFNCCFHLLTATQKDVCGLDSLSLLDPYEAFYNKSENNRISSLEVILDRLIMNNKNPRHSFSISSYTLPLLDAIDDMLRTEKIDMIIVNAQGRTYIQRHAFDKHVIQLVKNLKSCPIMVVPVKLPRYPLKDVTLLVDFTLEFNYKELETLVEIVNINQASLQILVINSKSLNVEQKKDKTDFFNYLKGIDYQMYELEKIDMVLALNCFVKIKNSDLICFFDQRNTLIDKLGRGRTLLDKFNQNKNLPFLILHE